MAPEIDSSTASRRQRRQAESNHLTALLQWARGSGVVIRGIQPAEIPGHGTGIVAGRVLKAGEILLEAPPHVVRCLNSVSHSIRRKLPANMPIHGLLAASLVLDDGLAGPWKAILPSTAALEASMPCLWPEELQALLPGDAQAILQTQQTNLRRQWGIFSKAFPEVPREEFQHAWMLVNSRSFLDGTPETEDYPWEDQLALVPVADLFNHSEAGSRVQVTSEGGYLVTTDRAYKKGEEVFISYGSHPNNYMLVEYGFILDHDKHDDVYLDDIIVPKLDEDERAELDKWGWLGKYPLSTAAEEAQRTQAALHLIFCSSDEWSQFLSSSKGSENGSSRPCQAKVDAGFIELLEQFLADIAVILEKLDGLDIGSKAQRNLLQRRWRQIATAVGERINELRRGSKQGIL